MHAAEGGRGSRSTRPANCHLRSSNSEDVWLHSDRASGHAFATTCRATTDGIAGAVAARCSFQDTLRRTRSDSKPIAPRRFRSPPPANHITEPASPLTTSPQTRMRHPGHRQGAGDRSNTSKIGGATGANPAAPGTNRSGQALHSGDASARQLYSAAYAYTCAIQRVIPEPPPTRGVTLT